MDARLVPGILIAVFVLIVAFAGGAAGEDPLTQEDVVRMFVQGMGEDELIARIDSSPGDYDLSEDMLAELRIAGIPEKVLDAMIRRQAELQAPAGDPPTDRTSEPSEGPRLVVRLNPDWKPNDNDALPVLRTLDSIDPQIAEQLDLRSQDSRITDIAVALMCKTADHVPDHWRSKSPLGRDFRVPRHRMLVLVSGADSSPASKFRNTLSKVMMAPGMRDSIEDLNLLTLEIPESLQVSLESGVAHDLVLGIALRVGDRMYLAMAVEHQGLVLEEPEGTTLYAVLRGKNKNPLKARLEFLEPDAED